MSYDEPCQRDHHRLRAQEAATHPDWAKDRFTLSADAPEFVPAAPVLAALKAKFAEWDPAWCDDCQGMEDGDLSGQAALQRMADAIFPAKTDLSA